MRWIVRVYGLIPDEQGRYLVLEEYFRGGWIMKFPGGGVEPEEGLEEALRREIREELGVEVVHARHFYTTEFFQRSYYHAAARLLAIYYLAWVEGEIRPATGRLRAVWLFPELMQLTFPIDRFVRGLLMAEGGDGPLASGPASGGHSGGPPARRA